MTCWDKKEPLDSATQKIVFFKKDFPPGSKTAFLGVKNVDFVVNSPVPFLFVTVYVTFMV